MNSGEALVDLAVGGAGLVWVCDFMMAHAQKAGQLVEVLAEAACEEHPIRLLTTGSRHVLPKVRVFIDFVARELAANGIER